jgi:hypothetical protein
MKSLFYQNIQNNKYRGYISEYQLLKEIKAHNVLLERVQLYHEFVTNLCFYLYETYLGSEYMTSPKDIEGHFNWGFNKVVNEFKEEGIDFSSNNYVKDYFKEYFTYNLYGNSTKTVDAVLEMWTHVFTLRPEKSKNEFEVLLDIYERFDTTFGNKKINS